jgi:hypothetical protein
MAEQIRVNGPNGLVVNFPAGTPRETINRVMQEAAGGRPAAPAPQMSQLDAAAQAARAGFLANFNDELAGARAAAVAGLPQSVQNAVNVPSVGLAGIARGVAPAVGGVRMLAERVFPQTFGSRATEAYAPARDVERALDKAAEEQFPNTYLGANIAGSVAMPLGFVGRGAKAAITAGGASGAASGFGRGEGAEDRLMGAAMEGGLGAAFGALPAVAMGTFNAGQRVLAPQSFAERLVRRTIEADRARGVEDVLTPADIAAARAAGQDIVVGDLGATGTLRLARAAGNTSEDAGARLRASTDPRYTEQKGRFGDFIEDLFGGNLNMTSTNDTLRDTARWVNAPRYRAAYQAGESANLWNPTLERLSQSPSVQAAIRDAESRAADRAPIEGNIVIRNPFRFDEQGRMVWGTTSDGGQILPNLQFWDQVQRNLREAAESAAPGSARQSDLKALRDRLNRELDTAVPEFGQARGMARQFFGAEDALEAGQTFFRQNRAIQLTDTQKAFRSMSEPERELFRRGFAAELANTVRNAPDSRDVVRLFDGANRRKLEVVMPPDELRQLEAFVRREGIMNRLRAATQGNSTTAQQLRDMSVGAGAGAGVGIFTAADPLTTGGTALLGGLLARIRSGVNENVMREVGEILSSSDPDRIKKLLSGPNGGAIMGAMRSLSQAVSNIGGGGRASAAPRTEPTVNVPQPQRMLPPPEPQRLLPPPDGFAKGGRVKEPKMSPIVEAIIEEMGKRMAPEGARRAAAIAGYSRGGAVMKVARALAERLVPEGGEATRGGLAASRAAPEAAMEAEGALATAARPEVRPAQPEMTYSMNPRDEIPFTFQGRSPSEWTPEEFQEVGRRFGVENLGPASPPQTFRYADESEFRIPGGLEGKFTYHDLLDMKAQGIDPSKIDRGLHTQIQQKILRTMTPDDVTDARVWDGLVFGMTSPNNPLFPNQLAQSRLRLRDPKMLDDLAGMIDWAPGQAVDKEARMAAGNRIASAFGLDAASKGGLGARGSADYTRVAELAKMFKENPAFFRKNEAEGWDQFVERISSQVAGLSMKTGSFGSVWQDPATAAISAIDRHMARQFEKTGGLFRDEAQRLDWENRVVDRWNKSNPDRQASSFYELRQTQGADGHIGKMLLEFVGDAKTPKFRLAPKRASGANKGDVNPNIPEHLKNVDWVSEPETVYKMGEAYRRALDVNDRFARENGLGLFGSQWMEWDRIRRRLEPHENMFPGLERIPAMSRAQLRAVDAEHSASGHKNYTKVDAQGRKMRDIPDDEIPEGMFLQPTRPRKNPARFGYFGTAGAMPLGGLAAAQRDEEN